MKKVLLALLLIALVNSACVNPYSDGSCDYCDETSALMTDRATCTPWGTAYMNCMNLAPSGTACELCNNGFYTDKTGKCIALPLPTGVPKGCAQTGSTGKCVYCARENLGLSSDGTTCIDYAFGTGTAGAVKNCRIYASATKCSQCHRGFGLWTQATGGATVCQKLYWWFSNDWAASWVNQPQLGNPNVGTDFTCQTGYLATSGGCIMSLVGCGDTTGAGWGLQVANTLSCVTCSTGYLPSNAAATSCIAVPSPAANFANCALADQGGVNCARCNFLAPSLGTGAGSMTGVFGTRYQLIAGACVAIPNYCAQVNASGICQTSATVYWAAATKATTAATSIQAVYNLGGTGSVYGCSTTSDASGVTTLSSASATAKCTACFTGWTFASGACTLSSTYSQKNTANPFLYILTPSSGSWEDVNIQYVTWTASTGNLVPTVWANSCSSQIITIWRDSCQAAITNCAVALFTGFCYACNVGFVAGTDGACAAEVSGKTTGCLQLNVASTPAVTVATACALCRPPLLLSVAGAGACVQPIYYVSATSWTADLKSPKNIPMTTVEPYSIEMSWNTGWDKNGQVTGASPATYTTTFAATSPTTNSPPWLLGNYNQVTAPGCDSTNALSATCATAVCFSSSLVVQPQWFFYPSMPPHYYWGNPNQFCSSASFFSTTGTAANGYGVFYFSASTSDWQLVSCTGGLTVVTAWGGTAGNTCAAEKDTTGPTALYDTTATGGVGFAGKVNAYSTVTIANAAVTTAKFYANLVLYAGSGATGPSNVFICLQADKTDQDYVLAALSSATAGTVGCLASQTYTASTGVYAAASHGIPNCQVLDPTVPTTSATAFAATNVCGQCKPGYTISASTVAIVFPSTAGTITSCTFTAASYPGCTSNNIYSTSYTSASTLGCKVAATGYVLSNGNTNGYAVKGHQQCLLGASDLVCQFCAFPWYAVLGDCLPLDVGCAQRDYFYSCTQCDKGFIPNVMAGVTPAAPQTYGGYLSTAPFPGPTLRAVNWGNVGAWTSGFGNQANLASTKAFQCWRWSSSATMCGAGSAHNVCAACPTGYAFDTSSTPLCQTGVTGCKTYSAGTSTCTACMTGYVAVGSPITACTMGTSLMSTTLANCAVIAAGTLNCQTCWQGYALNIPVAATGQKVCTKWVSTATAPNIATTGVSQLQLATAPAAPTVVACEYGYILNNGACTAWPNDYCASVTTTTPVQCTACIASWPNVNSVSPTRVQFALITPAACYWNRPGFDLGGCTGTTAALSYFDLSLSCSSCMAGYTWQLNNGFCVLITSTFIPVATDAQLGLAAGEGEDPVGVVRAYDATGALLPSTPASNNTTVTLSSVTTTVSGSIITMSLESLVVLVICALIIFS